MGAQVGVLGVAAEVLGEEGGAGDEAGAGGPRLLQQADGLGLLDGPAVEGGRRLGREPGAGQP